MFNLHFLVVSSARLFQCKHIRYIWDESNSKFVKLRGLDVNVPLANFHQLTALDAETRDARREVPPQ